MPDNATPDFRPDWAIDFHDLVVLAGNRPGPIVLRESRFDACSGSTTPGLWSFGRPQGRRRRGRGHPDPGAGCTGVNV